MNYKDAIKIGNEIIRLIKPHCEVCAIAGSLRRGEGVVKDIEVVAIAKPYDHGVFSDGLGAVVNNWHKVKGKMVYGSVKYTQRIIPAGFIEGSEAIKLDLFFTEEENWGRTFATRTGPAHYSHKTLATGWLKAGYTSFNNHLYKGGKRFDVPKEEDLFKLIGIPYVEPKYRF